MRVAIISSLVESKYGGPPAVVRLHAKCVRQFSEAVVYGVVDDSAGMSGTAGELGASRLFCRSFPRRWFRGRGLRRDLVRHAREFDVLHAHMLWDHSVFATWRAAERAGRPFIVTPHGSLAQAWRTAGAVKRVYKKLVLDRLFNDCAIVHVLNSHEEEAVRRLGVDCPIKIIPNGLDDEYFDQAASPDSALEKWPELSGRRVLLYLGRLWRDKGLPALIDAWAQATSARRFDEWCLVIAGPDYRGYRSALEQQISSLSLDRNVIVTGPVYGELKDSIIACSEAFVLLSLGEGFSMSTLEAIAQRKPVLLSPHCHFDDLLAAGGGWSSNAEAKEAAVALENIFQSSETALREIGTNGWLFARARYTTSAVRTGLRELYSQATG